MIGMILKGSFKYNVHLNINLLVITNYTFVFHVEKI